MGNLASFTDAGGQVLYFYDSVNLLSRLVEPGGEPEAERTTTFEYNSHDSRTETRYPGGVSQRVDYEESQAARDRGEEANDTGQIEGIKATRGDEVLTDLSWSFLNDSGQMTQLRQVADDHRRHEQTKYSYDHLDRLTVADTDGCTDGACNEDRERFSYRFDANTNRLYSEDSAGAPEVSYAYNETNALCWAYRGDSGSNHRCEDPPQGATDYDYDLNGNLTSASDGTDYDYNLKDQTSFAKAPGLAGQSMSFLGDDQQERKTRGQAAFGNSILGLSSSSASGRATYYTRGPGGELISQRSPEGRHYYLSDSLGSIVALTDRQGSVANRYRYDPFGNTMSQGTEESVSNPFRFGGEYYDSQIKLYKQGLRFYDPRLGRFTQRDPLDQVTEPRQSNRYVFAGCDPVNQVDPSGKNFLDDVGGFFSDNPIGQAISGCATGAAAGVTLLAPALVVPFGGEGVELVAGTAGCLVGAASSVGIGYNVTNVKG